MTDRARRSGDVPKGAFFPNRPRPLILGHRGAPLAAPENSLAAFEAALRGGADGVECDARLTAELAVVIHHDETLDRTAEGTGPVRSKTLRELRALRLRGGAGGERIPLLAEVLDLCRGRGGALVEAKVELPGEAEPLADAILREIDRAGGKGEVGVISFSHAVVARVAAKAPELPYGPIFDAAFAPAAALGSRPSLVVLERSLLVSGVVTPLLSAGAEVFSYSLDTEEDRRLARSVGVLGWISNLPDRRGV